MSLNPTIQFYTDILADIGIGVTSEGVLQALLPNNEVKNIKDTKTKKLVSLPLNELLRNNPKDYTFFHPLSESITKGEPHITQLFRGWIVYHLGSLSQELCFELMEVAVDPERQRKLSARQSVFLEFVGKTNSKTLEDMERVIKASGKAPADRFVNITLSKSTDTSQNWYRQANISFPVLEGEEDEAPFGVKNMSKTNARAVRGMLRYVFGHLGEVAMDAPNKTAVIGSSNDIAPYFDALLQTLIEFGSMYQDFIRLHKKILSPAFQERATFRLGWVDQIKDMESLRKRIPLIDDLDEPETKVKTVQRPKVQAGTAPAPAPAAPAWALKADAAPTAPTPQQQAYMPPAAPVAPVAAKSGAKSAAEFLREQQEAVAKQNFNPYQPQQYGGYGQPPMPQMGYGYPQMPQPNATAMNIQQRMAMANQQAYMNANQPQFGGYGMGFGQPQMGFGQPQMPQFGGYGQPQHMFM